MNTDDICNDISNALIDTLDLKIKEHNLHTSHDGIGIIMRVLSALVLAHNERIIDVSEQHKLFDWFSSEEKKFYERMEKGIKE